MKNDCHPCYISTLNEEGTLKNINMLTNSIWAIPMLNIPIKKRTVAVHSDSERQDQCSLFFAWV